MKSTLISQALPLGKVTIPISDGGRAQVTLQ